MANLRRLDAAKEQYGMQQGLAAGASVPSEGLAKDFPATAVACPADGVYTVGALGIDPSCSIDAHCLPYSYELEEFQKRARDAGAGPVTFP
jgi:hypothetical protein